MKANESMYTEERLSLIHDRIVKNGRVTVKELSNDFKISEVTIRHDLNYLAKTGKIIRTHGGAIPAQGDKAELPFDTRRDTSKEIKNHIARAASDLVSDGEVIFIDASTTAFEMIPCLNNKREVTVITNSLENAYLMARTTTLDVIILGGKVRKGVLSTISERESDRLDGIKISKAFFGAWGFTLDDGLTDVNPDEIKTKRSVAHNSREIIALIDSSKWGKVSYGTFVETENISVIISDTNCPLEYVQDLEAKDIKIIRV